VGSLKIMLAEQQVAEVLEFVGGGFFKRGEVAFGGVIDDTMHVATGGRRIRTAVAIERVNPILFAGAVLGYKRKVDV